MKIVQVKINDLDVVLDFWKAQHELHFKLDSDYYKPNSPKLDKLAKDYFEKTIVSNTPHILVAKIQNKVVGFITFDEKRSDLSGIEAFASNCSSYVEVIDLFIDEEFRGKNIGKSLMEKAEEYCQKVGLHKILVEVAAANIGAQSFYKKLGFILQQTKMFKKV